MEVRLGFLSVYRSLCDLLTGVWNIKVSDAGVDSSVDAVSSLVILRL